MSCGVTHSLTITIHRDLKNFWAIGNKALHNQHSLLSSYADITLFGDDGDAYLTK